MNKLDKILKLHELGYSKEEIDALVNESEIITIEDTIEKDASEAKTEEVKEEPDSTILEKEVKDSETNERLSSIEETLKAIQANNVKWSNMPTVEDKTELEIVQEILGGINKDGNE